MSKNLKRKLDDKPQAAQIEAIRRLAREGRREEARSRLRVLRQRFPDFRPLHGLALELEDEAGDAFAALARAFDWAQACPTSKNALSALTECAFALGFAALGADAGARLAALDGAVTATLPELTTPFGAMRHEEAVLTDISRILLAEGRYRDVMQQLKNATHGASKNNLALACFASGDVALALKKFEENWQAQPENLFALERVLRLRLWSGGAASIAALRLPLLTTMPLRAEDALGKINALILLGEWDAAEACWQAGASAEFWSPHRRDAMRGIFDYAGAVIALQRDDRQCARERIRLAGQANPDYPAIADLAARLARPDGKAAIDHEIGELMAWFPHAWYARVAEVREGPESGFEERLQRVFAQCDAHCDYLALAIQHGGAAAQWLGLGILKLRAKAGDTAAAAQLIALLTLPFGIDSDRYSLLIWLQEENLCPSDKATPVLLGGAINEIKPHKFLLTPEPTAAMPYPPQAQRHYDAMSEFLRARRPERALAEAETLHRLHPEIPMSHANLALIKEGIGHPDTQLEPLFRRALELDDAYVFARAGLARILVRRGEPDAAESMLKPVLSRDTYHFSEWRTILTAQRELAAARGNLQTVRELDDALQDLQRMQNA